MWSVSASQDQVCILWWPLVSKCGIFIMSLVTKSIQKIVELYHISRELFGTCCAKTPDVLVVKGHKMSTLSRIQYNTISVIGFRQKKDKQTTHPSKYMIQEPKPPTDIPYFSRHDFDIKLENAL